MDPNKARYAPATRRRARWPRSCPDADIFLGLSAGGVLKPEMVKAMAPSPLILALANPSPEIMPEDAQGGARRRHHRHRPLGLSEPGQQRPVLPVHLPRRARLRRHHDQRGDEDRGRARDRRAGAGRAVRCRGHAPTATAGCRSARDYLIPKPFDPRLIDEDRAGGGQGGDGQRRRDAPDRRHGGLSPSSCSSFVYHSGTIMKPMFAAAEGDAAQAHRAMPRARTSACCARCRSSSTRAWRRPILIGRPAGDRAAASRSSACGSRPGSDCEVDQLRRRRAIRDCCARPTTSSTAARACRRQIAKLGDAPPHDADRRDAAATGRGRRHDVRHLRHLSATTCATSTRCIGKRDGVHTLRRDEHADAAEGTAVHLRHPRQSRSDRRADRRDHAAGGRGGAALRPDAEGGAAVAFELRQLERAVGAARCARRWTSSRARRRTWRWTARCTATPRLSKASATRIMPGHRA